MPSLCTKFWSGQGIPVFSAGSASSLSSDLGALLYRGAFGALLESICSQIDDDISFPSRIINGEPNCNL